MTMLPTEKTTGFDNGLSTIKALFYGPPKIGKTNLCSGWPNTLFLATEKGYDALSIYVKDITSWSDFIEVVKALTTTKHEFKTVVIDTADILVRLCGEYVCNELRIKHISDAEWAKGYDLFKKEFDKHISKLFMANLGVILTSHSKETNITTRGGGSVTKIMSTLPNYARAVIVPKVSLVGLLRAKTVRQGSQVVEKRILSFKPTSIEEVGDRDGYLPDELECFKDPLKTYESFLYYYTKGQARKKEVAMKKI